jgi:mono/diheme cytochrome c family protein
MMIVTIRRMLRFGVVVLVGAFLLIQLIPYGRDHTNPPVVAEPAWDSPATRELAAAACFDCHSNETEWPWYTSVAPISWLTQHDVEEGRATLNFSEWNRPPETDEVSEAIREGSMPPWYYRLLHPAARLSDAELEQLIAGLEATFRASPA